MRREAVAAGAHTEFRGQIYGVRFSRLGVAGAVLVVDRGGPEAIAETGFVPTMSADKPAARIEVDDGGGGCFVEVAETLREAVFLGSTPAPVAAQTPWEDVVYASGVGRNFATDPWALIAARPSWAEALSIIWRGPNVISTSLKWEVYALDANGVVADQTLTPKEGGAGELMLPSPSVAMASFEQVVAKLGAVRSGTASDTIGGNGAAGLTGSYPQAAFAYLPAGGVKARVFQGNLNLAYGADMTFRWHRWKG